MKRQSQANRDPKIGRAADLREFRARQKANRSFYVPILQILATRVSEPGFPTRYEPVRNEEVKISSARLSAAQQKTIDLIMLSLEASRVAGNVMKSHGGTPQSDMARRLGVDLMKTTLALRGLAEANMSGPALREFIKLQSNLICLATQCGNLDSNSELPKRRARDRAEGMRQLRKSKIGPIIEGRRRRLCELLRSAPELVKGEPDPLKKRRKFRIWLSAGDRAGEWKRATLIRDIEVVIPLK
jgi:hypothetical protein